jgi:BirA family transcriptional regulator, biotin operon repressor / biotin---[acetyl-CoA-carboxylase] ligase
MERAVGSPSTPQAHTGHYDGVPAAPLAERLGVPLLVALSTTTSVLDDAHRLAAAGAPSGTLVLAEEQTAGRGRGGRRWTSRFGSGIWLTLVERAPTIAMLELLSIRLALAGAAAVERFAAGPVMVKWPNDLWVEGRKLAGILVEARWRDAMPEWLAIGVGVNVVPPSEEPRAIGLPLAPSRIAVLEAFVPALRAAVQPDGVLSGVEQQELARRDAARGRPVREPGAGIADGISVTGELLVRADDGSVRRFRTGSLVFQEEW